MAKRPTIKDVAHEAGVSVTTVDRAINGRMTVRPDTLEKIALAAHRVGYHARGLIDQRVEEKAPAMRLGFVLVKEKQEFTQNFKHAIERAVAARTDIRGTAVIRFAKSQSPEEFASLFRSMGPRVDALGALAVNHQSLDHVVEDLDRDGVPVVSLLNDFAQGIRRSYVGTNNIKIGRQAAWMICKTCAAPGKLAIFVGGNRWHGHDLREVGFRAYARDCAPNFTVLDTLVNLEARQLTYEATLDLLERHPDLRGIYVAGGGMEGAIAALREVRAPDEVSLVVNELTAESRAGLQDGYVQMVISTPLDEVCRDAVALMIRAKSQDAQAATSQQFLNPYIHLPELA